VSQLTAAAMQNGNVKIKFDEALPCSRTKSATDRGANDAMGYSMIIYSTVCYLYSGTVQVFFFPKMLNGI